MIKQKNIFSKLYLIFLFIFLLTLFNFFYFCENKDNIDAILDDIDYMLRLYRNAEFLKVTSGSHYATQILIEEIYEELTEKYVEEGRIEVTYHKGYDEFYKTFQFPTSETMEDIDWLHIYIILTINFEAKNRENIFSEIDVIFDFKQGFFHIVETSLVHPNHIPEFEEKFRDKEGFASWSRNLYAQSITRRKMQELVWYKFILSDDENLISNKDDFINKTYLKKYTNLTWY